MLAPSAGTTATLCDKLPEVTMSNFLPFDQHPIFLLTAIITLCFSDSVQVTPSSNCSQSKYPLGSAVFANDRIPCFLRLKSIS